MPTDDPLFQNGRSKYFVPSKTQSDALSTKIDPDFLPINFAGPYDQCLCATCWEREGTLNARREARVQQKQRIMDDIFSGDNERVYDIPGFLRDKGQYVPTEDDWLEFLEAKSTYERVAVLDRLNQEKAEKEAWMLKP